MESGGAGDRQVGIAGMDGREHRARDRQDLGAAVGREHGVFEVSGGRTVGGDDRPAVGQRPDAVASSVDHRFDRKGHPRPDPVAGTSTAEIGNFRLFVQVSADAVADKLPHYGKTVFFRAGLDSAGNIRQPVIFPCLFYAAGTIGASLVTRTSGGIKREDKHGRAITIAAIGWGISIALAGATKSLFFTLLFLGLAGASDMVSALFRGLIWNQSIADEYRGRLAGIELLSYSVGPLGGQMRSGTMAAWTNLRTSVVSGGLICIGFISIFATILPDFRKYDAKTNKFANLEREKRKNSEQSR